MLMLFSYACLRHTLMMPPYIAILRHLFSISFRLHFAIAIDYFRRFAALMLAASRHFFADFITDLFASYASPLLLPRAIIFARAFTSAMLCACRSRGAARACCACAAGGSARLRHDFSSPLHADAIISFAITDAAEFSFHYAVRHCRFVLRRRLLSFD
jgi:hypothetical protein